MVKRDLDAYDRRMLDILNAYGPLTGSEWFLFMQIPNEHLPSVEEWKVVQVEEEKEKEQS